MRVPKALQLACDSATDIIYRYSEKLDVLTEAYTDLANQYQALQASYKLLHESFKTNKNMCNIFSEEVTIAHQMIIKILSDYIMLSKQTKTNTDQKDYYEGVLDSTIGFLKEHQEICKKLNQLYEETNAKSSN